jgi:hypothetical protein
MGGCISSAAIWLRDTTLSNLGLFTATVTIATATAITVATAIAIATAIITTLVTLFTTPLFVFLGHRVFLWLTGRNAMSCPCSMPPVNPTSPLLQNGGYKATKRNLKYLRRYKAGKSIGFTMRSSLKAKGLIPRADGSYKVSPKYQTKKDVRRTRRRSRR